MIISIRFINTLIIFFFFVVLSTTVFAQPAQIPYHLESYELESGFYNGSNQAGNTILVYSAIVRADDSPWIQLHFGKTDLGRESYLTITSLKDGYWQKLDAISIEQWNHFSAFFNGSEVEIKLYAAPFDRNVFVHVNELVVGDWSGGTPYNTICGPSDDRIASDQPATGRLLSIGCTGWIIPNGKIATAGHCLSGANVMEFNVPLSLPGGTIQHPPPEDQYSVDGTTIVGTGSGVGNDWGVFEVFPNSITGLMPKEAQSAYWPLQQDLGPDSIRITGYGVDDGTANQTQQTHIGPNAGSSGTTMRYRTDTMGGNSGSPVINGLTNVAVGVHTHGGCTSSGGNNNGTSLFHSAFWAAVDMGAGGCPVELPSNPNPANNTVGVSINLEELTWTNGAGANTNELYFGTNPGSLSLVQSGTLATSWTITVTPFDYSTSYYWQVVEVGDTCNSDGPVWNFTTEPDPNIVVDTLFFDDFEGGIGQWTVTNQGGNCDWEVLLPPFPNSYTLPATSSGGLLAADSDECGSGTTFLSTATIVPILDLSSYSSGEVWIEFDNDWNIFDAQDEAHVEVSTDGGSTWTGVWDQIGTDIRSTHEAINVTSLLAGQSNVSVRVRSVQPGWDWWWVLDNFLVYGTYIVPVELTSFIANANDGNVELSWITATETNNSGFEIQRSTNGNFEAIAFINGKGTTTEPQAYSFTDEKVSVGIVNYRLKQIDLDGTFEYSNVIEVDVPAPSSFVLEQNYPNPFNPSTTIKFALPVETEVKLSVYNTIGEKVSEVFSGTLKEGYHEVIFEAASLTSGTYFYRLETNEFVDVKKMLILK
jgi:V8-like Glu-specific endopeptidase